MSSDQANVSDDKLLGARQVENDGLPGTICVNVSNQNQRSHYLSSKAPLVRKQPPMEQHQITRPYDTPSTENPSDSFLVAEPKDENNPYHENHIQEEEDEKEEAAEDGEESETNQIYRDEENSESFPCHMTRPLFNSQPFYSNGMSMRATNASPSVFQPKELEQMEQGQVVTQGDNGNEHNTGTDYRGTCPCLPSRHNLPNHVHHPARCPCHMTPCCIAIPIGISPTWTSTTARNDDYHFHNQNHNRGQFPPSFSPCPNCCNRFCSTLFIIAFLLAILLVLSTVTCIKVEMRDDKLCRIIHFTMVQAYRMMLPLSKCLAHWASRIPAAVPSLRHMGTLLLDLLRHGWDQAMGIRTH